MKNMTKGILASLSAAAVITTGAFIGTSAMTAEPEQTPTAVVVSVDENTLRQETPEIVRPTTVIPPQPVAETPAPVTVPDPAPEPVPEAWVNPDGSVEGGPGCPLPYVDLGYGCQVAICGIDENGNEIACQG